MIAQLLEHYSKSQPASKTEETAVTEAKPPLAAEV